MSEQQLGEFRPPKVNSALKIASRNAGQTFIYIIDVAPEDVRAEFERVERHGLMLLPDRRGGHVWTIWGTTLYGIDAVEAQPDPLPSLPNAEG